jgi:hypothetical protein
VIDLRSKSLSVCSRTEWILIFAVSAQGSARIGARQWPLGVTRHVELPNALRWTYCRSVMCKAVDVSPCNIHCSIRGLKVPKQRESVATRRECLCESSPDDWSSGTLRR